MTENQTAPPRKKKNLVIPIIGAVAVLVLTAGAFIGSYNARTDQLCSDAATATSTANGSLVSASKAASAAQESAKNTTGYAASENAAALSKALSEDMKKISTDDVGTRCSSRHTAAAMIATASSNTEISTVVTVSTTKLNADVAAFKSAEAARLAEEKRKADEAAAAA